jgi:UDP-N-acetylglucosamine diphosphorylase / glucose-1-phosphate thymidylyltransferase / UDP-N-acetylgalactosamine diphosphorylase / glucosamine-1-phosphate N-acetyltransferase / galactosamine-1-phosphate N-acetyltransferase
MVPEPRTPWLRGSHVSQKLWRLKDESSAKRWAATKVVVFEDDGLEGFGPLTLLRHTSLLRRGTKRLLDAIVEKIPDATDVALWGRPELSAVTRESAVKEFNEKAYDLTFFVNARARPSESLLSLGSMPGPFVALAQGDLVAGRLEASSLKPGIVTKKDVARLSKSAEKVDTPTDSLFKGYWDLVESNGLAVAEQARHFEDATSIPRTVEVRGPASNLMVEASVEIEGSVTLDARLGPIIIDRGASVESFTRIMGPSYIGQKVKLYSALVGGGTSIFEGCKVGGQVENSVILPYSNKAHHGYVGDSYVGSWVNLGAGCTFSNLKNTYGNVRLMQRGKRVDSGMMKLGPVVGDMAKLSIGSLVYAGKSVGTGSHVSGLASADIPSFTFSDSNLNRMVELQLESIIETQRRMMERRGLSLSRSEEGLIRRAYASTSKERSKAGVGKGRLQ